MEHRHFHYLNFERTRLTVFFFNIFISFVFQQEPGSILSNLRAIHLTCWLEEIKAALYMCIYLVR